MSDRVGYGIAFAFLIGAVLFWLWFSDMKTQECVDRGGTHTIGREMFCVDADGRVLE